MHNGWDVLAAEIYGTLGSEDYSWETLKKFCKAAGFMCMDFSVAPIGDWADFSIHNQAEC